MALASDWLKFAVKLPLGCKLRWTPIEEVHALDVDVVVFGGDDVRVIAEFLDADDGGFPLCRGVRSACAALMSRVKASAGVTIVND